LNFCPNEITKKKLSAETLVAWAFYRNTENKSKNYLVGI